MIKLDISCIMGLFGHSPEMPCLEDKAPQLVDLCERYVKTFFIYAHGSESSKRQKHLDEFFEKHMDNMRSCADDHLFLSEEEAKRHAQCAGKACGILEAYIPDPAIQGQGERLGVRKGLQLDPYIHGYYPFQDKAQYQKNPHFDERILDLED